MKTEKTKKKINKYRKRRLEKETENKEYVVYVDIGIIQKGKMCFEWYLLYMKTKVKIIDYGLWIVFW